MAPETPTLQNEYSDKFSADVGERLQDLDRRVREGKLERAKIRAVLDQVKTETDAKFADFQTKFAEFDSDGVDDEEIKKLAAYSVAGEDTGITDAEGRKIYRTQMISKMAAFLNEKAVDDTSNLVPEAASAILEAGMAALKYRNGTIEKSLWDAMRMVPDPKMLQGPKKRQDLAKKMAEGEKDLALGPNITLGGKAYTVTKVEILTGAAMTSFKPELLTSLKIQNAILIGNQIWARMQNGCQGNLVIVDVTEGGVVVPEEGEKYPHPQEFPENIPQDGKWAHPEGSNWGFAKVPDSDKGYARSPGNPPQYYIYTPKDGGGWDVSKIPEGDLPSVLRPAAVAEAPTLIPGEDPNGQAKFEKITEPNKWMAVEGGEADTQYAKLPDVTDKYYSKKEVTGQAPGYKMAELQDRKWIWKDIPESELPPSLKIGLTLAQEGDPNGKTKFDKITEPNKWMVIEGGDAGWQYAKEPDVTDKYYAKKETAGQPNQYQVAELKDGKWKWRGIQESELPTSLKPAEILKDNTEANFNRLAEENKKLREEFKQKGGNMSDLDISIVSGKDAQYEALGFDSNQILGGWAREQIENSDSTKDPKEIDTAKLTAANTVLPLENAILQKALNKINGLPIELTLLPSHEQTSDGEYIKGLETKKGELEKAIAELKGQFINVAKNLQGVSYFKFHENLLDADWAGRNLDKAFEPEKDLAIKEEEYHSSLSNGVTEYDYDFPGTGTIMGYGEDKEQQARDAFVNDLLQACKKANVVPPHHPKELGGVFEKKGDWKASQDITPKDIQDGIAVWVVNKQAQKERFISTIKDVNGQVIAKNTDLASVTRELDFEKDMKPIGLLKGSADGQEYTIEEKGEGDEKTYHLYYKASADADPTEIKILGNLNATYHPDIFQGGETAYFYLRRNKDTGQISFKINDEDVRHVVLKSKDNVQEIMEAPPLLLPNNSEDISNYANDTFQDATSVGIILSDLTDYEVSSTQKLWLGTLAVLKGPDKFLKEDGEELWQHVRPQIDGVWNTPGKKADLIVALDHILETTAVGKIDFAAEVEGGKYKNEEYEANWNKVQKFCYRREKQLPGFTAWMRGKLDGYKAELDPEIDKAFAGTLAFLNSKPVQDKLQPELTERKDWKSITSVEIIAPDDGNEYAVKIHGLDKDDANQAFQIDIAIEEATLKNLSKDFLRKYIEAQRVGKPAEAPAATPAPTPANTTQATPEPQPVAPAESVNLPAEFQTVFNTEWAKLKAEANMQGATDIKILPGGSYLEAGGRKQTTFTIEYKKDNKQLTTTLPVPGKWDTVNIVEVQKLMKE